MIDKLKLPPFTFALGAAFLFGASTPACKVLLANVQPVLLAGVMYLASGLGLGAYSLIKWLSAEKHARESTMTSQDLPWLIGIILFGGIAGPLLLMFGLSCISASSASLLLNLEGAFTALLAWFALKENFDRRIALGMVAIIGGGLVLSFRGQGDLSISYGVLAIAAACLCWAVDNNLTRKLSGKDPVHTAAIKGCAAGAVNCIAAFALGAHVPEPFLILLAGLVGLLGYGISLAVYIRSLRYLGTARTSAYFSTAPFIGAAVSIGLLHEPITGNFLLAAALMGLGVWLHITESHAHEHTHEEIDHDHMHYHDEHHMHDHDPSVPIEEPHSHPHHHGKITHTHPHFPDLHHRHGH
jgi:drug/metabolite transporter (DMT)-like permease